MSNITLRNWKILTAAAAAVLLLGFPGVVCADSIAYDVTSSAQFGTVNLNTGVFTLINGSQSAQLAGLGEANGNLYGGGFTDQQLYQVNTVTGQLTAIGSAGSGRSYSAFGSTLNGLLYATDNATVLNLYSIDPSTGTRTLIGSTGLTRSSGNWLALSTGDNTLYFSLGNSAPTPYNTNFYSLNLATGLATFVTSRPWPEIGGIVFEDGTFYFGSNLAPYGVFAIPPDGQVATESGAPATSQGPFWGLAPVPVPEPASLLLLGTGLVGLRAWRKRRQ